jgi:hypothetical protein
MRDTEWRDDTARDLLEVLLSQALIAVMVIMGLALCWHALP